VTIESPGHADKLQSVQLLRAAAALLVVFYHLSTTAPFGRLGPGDRLGAPAGFFEAVGFAGVDLFFVISGVVMVVACGDQVGARASGRFLLRRATRIYPLYWLATLAVLAACWLRPELAVRDKLSADHVAKSLVLWPQAEFPIVAVGWTLTYEMFFYLVFAALLALPRPTMRPLLAAWAVLTLVMFAATRASGSSRTIHSYLEIPVYASPLVLEFIIGCFVGEVAKRGTLKGAIAALAIGILVMTTAGAYAGSSFPAESQYGVTRLVVFGLPAALIVYGAVGLELAGRASIPRWTVFWGDASYSTYLIHVYVIWIFSRLWSRELEFGPTWQVWTAAAACLVAIAAASAACYVCVERPLQRRLVRALGRPFVSPAQQTPTELKFARGR
jgi:peptidoglycan/LPS O-acetylase OafA/YrhL